LTFGELTGNRKNVTGAKRTVPFAARTALADVARLVLALLAPRANLSGGQEKAAMSAPDAILTGDELLAGVTEAMVAFHERYDHRKPTVPAASRVRSTHRRRWSQKGSPTATSREGPGAVVSRRFGPRRRRRDGGRLCPMAVAVEACSRVEIVTLGNEAVARSGPHSAPSRTSRERARWPL
jgi:hypothetical protein